jgi:hypothetical protein
MEYPTEITDKNFLKSPVAKIHIAGTSIQGNDDPYIVRLVCDHVIVIVIFSLSVADDALILSLLVDQGQLLGKVVQSVVRTAGQ